MIDIKTPEEITIMKEGGRRLGVILKELLEYATVGISLMEIELLAQKRIREAGSVPSFTSVENYQYATCLCVNDDVVHCIPTGRKLEEGDMLTIDVGLIYQGFHTDTAWTKIVRSSKFEAESKTEKFLKIGEETLWKAIAQARAGNRIGNISQVIQDGIMGNGYHVVKSLVGHGVGRELHEDPQIPGLLTSDISRTPELKQGMTVAIEIIYAMGSGQIEYAGDDGWTLATQDGSLSAVFEHSLAIGDGEPVVLTKV